MSTSIVPPKRYFSAAHVARVVGLDELALRKLHPGVFPAEECWHENAGRLHYTEHGVELLVESLTRCGYSTRGHSLRVWLNQHRETPSASMVPPGPKTSVATQYEWQRRADLQ
ncbi:MAG TPA: hypothetical protein VHD61_15580 [Lacunisphaera sp.]|nr:hypothetical protein [Lacunisphaera sp.]